MFDAAMFKPPMAEPEMFDAVMFKPPAVFDPPAVSFVFPKLKKAMTMPAMTVMIAALT